MNEGLGRRRKVCFAGSRIEGSGLKVSQAPEFGALRFTASALAMEFWGLGLKLWVFELRIEFVGFSCLG